MQCGTVLPIGRRRWTEVVELLKRPLSKETYQIRDTDSMPQAFSQKQGEISRQIFITIKDDMRALLFQKLMEEKWPHIEPVFFENGTALREMLVASTDSQLPAAVILDLSKSCTDMQKALSYVKSTQRLLQIPVLAFSPSSVDTNQNYTLGANGVIRLTSDLSEFMQAVERLCYYWFSMVALPVIAERVPVRS